MEVDEDPDYPMGEEATLQPVSTGSLTLQAVGVPVSEESQDARSVEYMLEMRSPSAYDELPETPKTPELDVCFSLTTHQGVYR